MPEQTKTNGRLRIRNARAHNWLTGEMSDPDAEINLTDSSGDGGHKKRPASRAHRLVRRLTGLITRSR